MKKYTCPQIQVIELRNEFLLAGSGDGGVTEIETDNISKEPVDPWNGAASKENPIWDNGGWLAF